LVVVLQADNKVWPPSTRPAVPPAAVRMNCRRSVPRSVFVARTVLRNTENMFVLAHLIASEDHHGGGGTNILPFALVALGVGGAILVQRSRMQKARARVTVRRVPDGGRVQLDRLPDAHSLAVGVRVQPDPTGTQTLLEDVK
jgi:hypothetical protein